MRGIGRITGGAKVGGAKVGAGRAVGGGIGRGGFTMGLAAGGAAGGPERAAAVAVPFGIGLLALQERGGEAARNQAAARRADSLLEELQGLQADVLRGGADPARLARLAALGDGEEGVDAGLREAVRAIGLRARIELARRNWGKAMSSP